MAKRKFRRSIPRPNKDKTIPASSDLVLSDMRRPMSNETACPDSSAMVEQVEPSTRCSSMLDLDHVWHSDNYGTQFTNASLTIAINGLSLDKEQGLSSGGCVGASMRVESKHTFFRVSGGRLPLAAAARGQWAEDVFLSTIRCPEFMFDIRMM
ncbi:hypothetical protein ACFX13_039021 [Malus domestica]